MSRPPHLGLRAFLAIRRARVQRAPCFYTLPVLSPQDVEDLLLRARTVPVLQGGMARTKELCGACLDAGIPATLVRPPQGGG